LRKSRGSVPRLSHREQCHSVMGASALLMGRWRGRGASATLAALERRRSDGLCRSGCAGASGAGEDGPGVLCVLRDVTAIDTSVSILGHKMPAPIMVAPTGRHKLFHPEGERATARGAAAA